MDKRFMTGAMPDKSFKNELEKIFWRIIFESHLDEFHIDRTEEELKQRLRTDVISRASSFENLDDEHDVLDMLLEEIKSKSEKIKRFLDFQGGYRTLQWITNIPEGYGSLLVTSTGEVYYPRKMVIVIRKDKYNTIEWIDAYPVML